AEAIAARILNDASVQVEFKDDVRSCGDSGNHIVITLLDRTPVGEYPGRLAYAMPFERIHIVVFHDRVLGVARTSGVQSLLGHVLAHEIVHMFQGVEHHSSSGIMKEKWDLHDYVEMQHHNLRFTEEDRLLIRQGLQNRASKGAASGAPVK